MANGGKVVVKIVGDDKGFKNTVKNVKSTAVKALGVTTKAQAAAQHALNTAINANPIGIAVADFAALAAGVDYKIGDIVRIQKGGITSRKLVEGIDMWQETDFGEEPKLTDYEEGEA